MSKKQSLTRILKSNKRENQQVVDALFELVYEELYKIAHSRRRRWNGNDTLNTTAILHEAYLKMADQPVVEWQSKTHFFAAVSKAMRHILMNYARDQNREKRGGDQNRVTLDQLDLAANSKTDLSDKHKEALLMLDEALKRLEKENQRLSEIVECRFFGGMTIEETAASLGLSPSTVKRGWNTAQLWLFRELH